MPSPTMSANVRGTIGGTRKQRGAEKLPEEFPNTWADAWDGYEYTMLAEGQSTNSTRTRRSSVLRLAKAYPRQEPETLTRRDIERHITGVRKHLQPVTVFNAFYDLKSFFEWLANDT